MEWRKWNLSEAETEDRGGELWFLPEAAGCARHWFSPPALHVRVQASVQVPSKPSSYIVPTTEPAQPGDYAVVSMFSPASGRAAVSGSHSEPPLTAG